MAPVENAEASEAAGVEGRGSSTAASGVFEPPAGDFRVRSTDVRGDAPVGVWLGDCCGVAPVEKADASEGVGVVGRGSAAWLSDGFTSATAGRDSARDGGTSIDVRGDGPVGVWLGDGCGVVPVEGVDAADGVGVVGSFVSTAAVDVVTVPEASFRDGTCAGCRSAAARGVVPVGVWLGECGGVAPVETFEPSDGAGVFGLDAVSRWAVGSALPDGALVSSFGSAISTDVRGDGPSGVRGGVCVGVWVGV